MSDFVFNGLLLVMAGFALGASGCGIVPVFGVVQFMNMLRKGKWELGTSILFAASISIIAALWAGCRAFVECRTIVLESGPPGTVETILSLVFGVAGVFAFLMGLMWVPYGYVIPESSEPRQDLLEREDEARRRSCTTHNGCETSYAPRCIDASSVAERSVR